MKLYYSRGACSLAVRIVIHELGLAAEFEAVNLKTKQTETGGDFLKVNPKGSVPVLAIDQKEVLTENLVIQQYLADSHQPNSLLPNLNDFSRYRVLEWLNFVSTELHKGFSPFFNPKVTEEMKNDIFLPVFKTKLNYVDQHLKQRKYLFGDIFTLPDAYLFVILLWLPQAKLDINQWQSLSRYFADLKKRPAIQQSLQEEKIA